MNPLDVRKDNIWMYAQNKPSLIAKDFSCFDISPDITYKILLSRGVFKWLSVRRRLIVLKNDWKTIIRGLNEKLAGKNMSELEREYARGYLKAYEECRKQVRCLCHSDRWQAPDFDRGANEFLNGYAQESIDDYFGEE